MKKLILSILTIILFLGCTDEKGAKSFLKKEGYSDIKTTGYITPPINRVNFIN